MNIHAKRFDKVRYLDKNGYDSEREIANKCLIKGNEYTVSKTNVGGYSSTVELIEFPGRWFNTVMFEDVVIVIENHFMSNGSGLAKTIIEGESKHRLSKAGLDGLSRSINSIPARHRGLSSFKSSSENKFPHNGQNLTAKEIFMESSRNPMKTPVYTKSRSEKDWYENLLIPHQTVDRHSIFDDHFKIIGILDRGVRKNSVVRFSDFDWNQLFNRTVSEHKKYGKTVSHETYHILSFSGNKKFTIIAEMR